MRRTVKRLLIIAVVVGLGVVSARAARFSWSTLVKPPLSLKEALGRAKLALGEEAAQRYCIEATLFGNPMRKEKPGTWKLYFGAADGSNKLVTVNMDGAATISVWERPLAKRRKKIPPAHAGLDELHRQLVDFFQKESLDVDFQVDDNQLTVLYRPQQFHVYKRLPGGEFSNELEEVTGPQQTGLWLTIRETTQPYAPDDFWAPYYWTTFKRTFYTATPGRYFLVEIRSGAQFNGMIVWRLKSAIGKPAPRSPKP